MSFIGRVRTCRELHVAIGVFILLLFFLGCRSMQLVYVFIAIIFVQSFVALAAMAIVRYVDEGIFLMTGAHWRVVYNALKTVGAVVCVSYAVIRRQLTQRGK